VAKIICGVDVSSQVLDARIGADGPIRQFERSAEGIAELAAFCRTHAVELVAMEATGGYERLAFMLLWAAQVPCAIVNPRAVRRFAEGMGLLEKTDRIDAGVIAWYAAVKRIVAQWPPDEAQQRLTALVGRLRQLTELLVMQGNQRRLVSDADVLASIDAVIALLRNQIRQFEDAIAALSTAIRSGARSSKPSAASKASPVARWPASWPTCRRSEHSTTRPSPSSQDLPRSPKTPAKSPESDASAAVEARSARSSLLLPRSSAAMIPTSPPSIVS
jgi:transposase